MAHQRRNRRHRPQRTSKLERLHPNRELIPDPKALIDSCHARGVTVSLNDHPHDGMRPHEEHYPAFIKALGVTDGTVPLFNTADSNYMAKFFDYAHRPSEDMGVDFVA